MKSHRFGKLVCRLAGAHLAALAILIGVSAPSISTAPAVAAVRADDEKLDQVIFRDGRIIEGVIAEETDKTVSIYVVVGKIKGSVPTTYNKADVLSVVHHSEKSEAGKTEPARETGAKVSEKATEASASPGQKVVYHIKLDGWFGRDFNVTPLQEAVDDAKRYNPDYLLVEVDNRWGRFGQDFGDDRASFDQFMIADKLEPVLRQDLQTHWSNPPEVIVWVKNAMAGAAFIPFFTPHVYFASDGRMGGIGDLGDMFEGVGDEMVRDKQRSLRLAWAKGMALASGYDPHLVEAMTVRKYVLYYMMQGGHPVYFNEPTPGAELLTDDGEKENVDSDEQRVRGEGNDVLTLRAELAQKLGVSKGTADSIDDVMFFEGVSDYTLIDDAAERDLSRWSETIDRLEREIPKMFQEYQQIQVGGDYYERKRARGSKINILKKIVQQVERYQESLQFTQMNVPPPAQLRVLIEQLRLQQLADRP